MFWNKEKVCCSDCMHRSKVKLGYNGETGSIKKYGCIHPKRIITDHNYITGSETTMGRACDIFNSKGKCKLWETKCGKT